MTDANLVRVLQAQLHTDKKRRVGLINYHVVAQAGDSIRRRIDELIAEGYSIAIVDALSKHDLDRVGEALGKSRLLTASSGLGGSLPRNWGFSPATRVNLPPTQGRKAILAGSCSVATNAQVQRFIRDGGAAYVMKPMQLATSRESVIAKVLAWADSFWGQREERAFARLLYSGSRSR